MMRLFSAQCAKGLYAASSVTTRRSEAHNFLHNLVAIVAYGKDEILVASLAYKVLDKRIDGNFRLPVVLVHEHHRTCVAKRHVVVLHSILKDFLQSACRTWREDDAAFGYGQNAVLANGVVEVFGYVCGKWG